MASNGRLLALMLQSDDPYVLQIYMVAAILALLVGLAGIFMIAGSLNSSTARRTEFFGMMRCLGATRKQVSRLVKREALGWCFRAVPAGIGLGCAVIWILCAVLRILSPGIFEGMPLFGISWIGIVCGGAGGFLTVLLAARSPAKKLLRSLPRQRSREMPELSGRPNAQSGQAAPCGWKRRWAFITLWGAKRIFF